MCGIVGYIGKRKAYPILMEGLHKLEYRGYDSAGTALISESGSLNLYKAKGKVADLESVADGKDVSGTLGIAHHKHVQELYKELLKDVEGVTLHEAPNADYDSNYWLCTVTLDSKLKIQGQENAYKEVVKTAVGGAAGVIHMVDTPTTDCQPNENVEALRVFMLSKKIEARPVWKPMHKQPVYQNAPAYVNGVSEAIFKVGVCLPAGPMVTDDDVRYIVESIKEAIV